MDPMSFVSGYRIFWMKQFPVRGEILLWAKKSEGMMSGRLKN